MEGKVLLYDSHDNKIGETFTRRARQLVKQQRATWTDDNHNAIRFAPGMENMDDQTSDDVHDEMLLQRADEELLRLARRRVHSRFALTLHFAIVVCLSVLLVIIYQIFDSGGYFWPIWPISAFTLSIVIHTIVSKMAVGDSMHNQINLEYERLKNRRSH